MNDSQLSPDDPRLTAYALGELEGDERAEIEAALRRDPAARALVEEIRAATAQIEAALAAETTTEATLHVLEGAGGSSKGAPRPGRQRRGSWPEILRLPQLYYVVGGLAAACFAVFVAMRPERPLAPAARYVEVPLSPVPSPAAPSANTSAPMEAGKNAGLDSPPPVPRGALELDRPQPEAVPVVEPLSVETSAKELLAGQPAIEVPAPTTQTADALAGREARPEQSVASARRPSPDGLAEKRESPRVVRAPGAEDVVTLSPFEISVDRETGNRIASPDTRAERGAQRAALPRAPRGARFAAAGETELEAGDNEFLAAAGSPLSTFSPEVETASYGSTRRFLEAGRLPPREAVRIEELLNYFPYRYAAPQGDAPFAAELTVTEAPWAPAHRLVRIALKGRETSDLPGSAAAPHMRAPTNLVFLIDVSASMKARNKLPVVQDAIRRLVTRLQPDDRVAIVTYSGSSGLVLPSLPAARAKEIGAAVDALVPGRGTSELSGLPLAYNVARTNFVPNGINRVVLCTDGDFDLGVADEGELLRLVANRAQFGISLSVLGLGMGESRHSMVQSLAARGKGRFGYIETRAHAERLLAAEVETTLTAIAQDVKIQVEFNPVKVARYRLLGYENRRLRPEDFNDDHVDGAELGAGHALTALYEIVPHGLGAPPKEEWAALPDLRYGQLRPVTAADGSAGRFDGLSNELLTVKIRYKKPDGLVSRKLEFPLTDRGGKFAEASGDFKFAAAVAGFGMILRNSPHRGNATLRDVIAWAGAAATNAADDPGGYRREFIGLAQRAQGLLQ